MTERYCEWCHTATGLHLPDCPTVIPDPYADDQQPARAGTKVRGRIIHTNGYPMIYMPSHPRATVKGYVSEHVLIVEKAIGKFLRKTAPVHHVDENKQNNAPGNLVACQDSAYHSLLHRRAAALRACGDASAVRCQYCGEYARQSELMRHKQGKRVRFCHADCSRSKNRQYASKRRRQATSHEVGSLVGSPYDPAYAPALWGSMWGPDMNGQPRPQGKPEDIPTETIYRKPKNV